MLIVVYTRNNWLWEFPKLPLVLKTGFQFLNQSPLGKLELTMVECWKCAVQFPVPGLIWGRFVSVVPLTIGPDLTPNFLTRPNGISWRGFQESVPSHKTVQPSHFEQLITTMMDDTGQVFARL
ncbi:hypothetical protein STHE1630_00204 [Streptococcus thermophilus CNCM I-1630]|nr:hypothetical protein STHE1630_00204 [Streptococcus thermophilus CNCM I-1630]